MKTLFFSFRILSICRQFWGFAFRNLVWAWWQKVFRIEIVQEEGWFLKLFSSSYIPHCYSDRHTASEFLRTGYVRCPWPEMSWCKSLCSIWPCHIFLVSSLQVSSRESALRPWIWISFIKEKQKHKRIDGLNFCIPELSPSPKLNYFSVKHC